MSLSRKLREARQAWELGRMLQLAIRRGRNLHPWVSQEHSLTALWSEVSELSTEVRAESADRVRAEALDCAVVALRIMLGY